MELLKPIKNINFLTKPWLENVLTVFHSDSGACGNIKNVSVQDMIIDIPKEREGFLSEIAYIEVKYSLQNVIIKEQLIVKFLPNDENLALFLRNLDLVQREVKFYEFTKLEEFKRISSFSNMDNIIPLTLFAGCNENNFTLVMKNLKSIGYKVDIIRDGTSVKQLKVALEALAVIHATGLFYKSKYQTFPVARYEDNSMYEVFLLPNLDKLADIFTNSPSISNSMLKMKTLMCELRTFHMKNPLFETVIHGDLWAGQCLFSQCGNQATLLDWQFTNVGSPVTDIMSMFFMSANLEDIKDDLQELLTHYWKCLTNYLKFVNVTLEVSYSEFEKDFEKHWITGFLFLGVSIHDFLGADNISEKRLKETVEFLHRNSVFNNFIKNPNKNTL